MPEARRSTISEMRIRTTWSRGRSRSRSAFDKLATGGNGISESGGETGMPLEGPTGNNPEIGRELGEGILWRGFGRRSLNRTSAGPGALGGGGNVCRLPATAVAGACRWNSRSASSRCTIPLGGWRARPGGLRGMFVDCEIEAIHSEARVDALRKPWHPGGTQDSKKTQGERTEMLAAEIQILRLPEVARLTGLGNNDSGKPCRAGRLEVVSGQNTQRSVAFTNPTQGLADRLHGLSERFLIGQGAASERG